MAKFKSLIFSEIRGKLGGLVFTANQFQSLIVRQFVSPVNPNTTNQTAIRSAFSGAVALWSTITDAVREDWEQYAATLTFEGPLGQYNVPGRSVFIANIGLALYLKARDGTPAVVDTAAPIIPGFLNIENVGISTYIGPGTGIAYSYTNATGADALAVSTISIKFGPPRRRFKGPFLSDTLVVNALPDATSVIEERDPLVVDGIYFVRIRFISALAPFRISSPFFLRTIAITVV